jgi:hypothetical protein
MHLLIYTEGRPRTEDIDIRLAGAQRKTSLYHSVSAGLTFAGCGLSDS